MPGADHERVQTSSFDKIVGHRHQRRVSSSLIGRSAPGPRWINIQGIPSDGDRKAPGDLVKKESHNSTGTLNGSYEYKSQFATYEKDVGAPRQEIGLRRHQRPTSPSLVGRSGGSMHGAYTKFTKEHFGPKERIRQELDDALKNEDLDQFYAVYIREETELPLENTEVHKAKCRITRLLQRKLMEARESGNRDVMAKWVAMTEQQAMQWPYARAALDRQEYYETLLAIDPEKAKVAKDRMEAQAHLVRSIQDVKAQVSESKKAADAQRVARATVKATGNQEVAQGMSENQSPKAAAKTTAEEAASPKKATSTTDDEETDGEGQEEEVEEEVEEVEEEPEDY